MTAQSGRNMNFILVLQTRCVHCVGLYCRIREVSWLVVCCWQHFWGWRPTHGTSVGTTKNEDGRSIRRITCCGATVCIANPPGNGSSLNPDRPRHGTCVKTKIHLTCISKIQLPSHIKHSPFYKDQPGSTTWRNSHCLWWESNAAETRRTACGQIQIFWTLEQAVDMSTSPTAWTDHVASLLLRTWSVKPYRLSQPEAISVWRDCGTPRYTCHCYIMPPNTSVTPSVTVRDMTGLKVLQDGPKDRAPCATPRSLA
jgi:hypothetical protein